MASATAHGLVAGSQWVVVSPTPASVRAAPLPYIGRSVRYRCATAWGALRAGWACRRTAASRRPAVLDVDSACLTFGLAVLTAPRFRRVVGCWGRSVLGLLGGRGGGCRWRRP